MNVAVLGTGYVGLVSGTCFADSGNRVTCIDIDPRKVELLQGGEVPIYEPGLAELVQRNAAAGRLRFTTLVEEGVAEAEVVFLAVGTPQRDDGSANLAYLMAAAESLAPHLRPEAVVVIKSTVPVGTNARVAALLAAQTGRTVEVASNPEFLKEGAAIDDFTKPDRVVVGARTKWAADRLELLYSPFLRTGKPFLVMSPESAELTKYAANALLATRISFINEIANLSELVGADVDDVRRGIGSDLRIGPYFLFPGAGYGGSCFPKDVRALHSTAREVGFDSLILPTVDAVNERQKRLFVDRIERHFGPSIAERTIAVWGLAFKPKTDDIREAPALVLLDRLLELGANVRVHDPEAMENVRALYGDRLTYCDFPLETLDRVDALAIVTEWGEFRNPDFAEMRRRMKSPLIFDGRNLYRLRQMREAGFDYYSIGRPAVLAGSGSGE